MRSAFLRVLIRNAGVAGYACVDNVFYFSKTKIYDKMKEN